MTRSLLNPPLVLAALMTWIGLIACAQVAQPETSPAVMNHAPESNYRVLVGAFSSAERADHLANRLKEKGFTPYITQQDESDLHLVGLNPIGTRSFTTRQEADRVVLELSSLGMSASVFPSVNESHRPESTNTPESLNLELEFVQSFVQEVCDKTSNATVQNARERVITASYRHDLSSATLTGHVLSAFQPQLTHVSASTVPEDDIEFIICETQSTCGCLHTDMCFSERVNCCDSYRRCYTLRGELVSEEYLGFTCPDCCGFASSLDSDVGSNMTVSALALDR